MWGYGRGLLTCTLLNQAICVWATKYVKSNGCLLFKPIMKQDSPPAGNRKRRTCRVITCQSVIYPEGSSTPSSPGRGWGYASPGWEGVPHPDLARHTCENTTSRRTRAVIHLRVHQVALTLIKIQEILHTFSEINVYCLSYFLIWILSGSSGTRYAWLFI